MTILVAAPAISNAQAAGNWGIRCKDQTQCTVGLGLNQPGTGQRVATMLATINADDDAFLIGAAIGLGAALTPGMKISWGDTEVQAAFEVCYPDGCRAIVALTADQRQSLVEAETLEIRYFPFASETPIAVDVPLAGFADKVAEAEAKLRGN